MPIIPINSVNTSPTSQTNVIPQAGRKRLAFDNKVNFGNSSAEKEENESSHWFLKLLLGAVGVFVAYKLLKNPVKNIFKDYGKDNFIDLFKKAEKKETFAWKDAEEHMKGLHKSNKDIETGFLLRLTDDQRTMFDVVPNEGIALGYKLGDSHVVTKTFACDKLDQKCLDKLGNDRYYQFA